jgi:hypothetical protein
MAKSLEVVPWALPDEAYMDAVAYMSILDEAQPGTEEFHRALDGINQLPDFPRDFHPGTGQVLLIERKSQQLIAVAVA